jgi:hypothetical protein
MASIELIKAVAATAELCGAKLSEAAADMLVQDLSAYPERAVMVALNRVRKSGKRFSLGLIIEEIDQNDGRPGADTAWAMLPRDESQTVVWTNEMQQAWGVASPLMDMGDKFGARRAFCEAYDRIVEQARENGVAPRWEASLGLDPHGRESALREAVRKGYLLESSLPTLLPAPDMTRSPIAAIAFGAANTPLLEHDGGGTETSRERALEMLARLREAIKPRPEPDQQG